MRSIRKNNCGTLGFYDEMIVFFVVVLGLVLFFFTALRAYDDLSERSGDIGSLADVQRVTNSIRKSPLLTHDGQDGVFEADKVLRLNPDNLTREIGLPEGTFIRVEILDLSNYSVSYEGNVTNFDPTGDAWLVADHRSVLTTPVAIRVDDEQVHPGQLKVEVWR